MFFGKEKRGKKKKKKKKKRVESLAQIYINQRL
jgi:hypothetical protein